MTNAEMIEQTKTMLIGALFSLMREQTYPAITMVKIAARAGVGRATAYRYFQSKEDIIREYFARNAAMFNDIAALPIQSRDDYYEIIFRVFSALKEQKETVRLIMQANLEFLYLDFLNRAMVANFQINRYAETAYTPYYFAGSLFNVSMQWIRNDCAEPVRRVADVYFALLFGERLSGEEAP